MKKFNKKGGFTLIELLVVIAIIGILASIVLVSLNGARKKGSDARVISDVQETRTAFETGFNGAGYPDLIGGVSNCNAANLSNANTSQCINATGPDNTNISTLSADATSQGGKIYYSTPTGAAPMTAYAIRGQLVSAPANDFCIDSTGNTDPSESFTVSTSGSPTCH